MIAWIVQISIISILFIFLIHHLICFFKNTLTIPKIKDLVRSSSKKYENIYSILKETDNQYIDIDIDSSQCTDINLLQPISSMKDELKNFLKTQMSDDIDNGNPFSNQTYNIE